MISSWLLVILCVVVCKCDANEANIYEYQLPDDDLVKSLNITVNRKLYIPIIHVYCNNYDSLKYLDIRPGALGPFYPSALILLNFVGCFNNETDNGNYNYRLWDAISHLPNFSEYDQWYGIDFALDEYAVVNSDALLGDPRCLNFGFETSNYLNNYTCKYCTFSNIKHLDFNDVRTSMIADRVSIFDSELINFNSENMKKLSTMTVLEMYNFSLADQHAFNVPHLFEHNGNLQVMIIEGSKHKITLHKDVFRGLNDLRRLTLVNLQLDYIAENLFADLRQAHEISLISNNIKTLHPNTFAHLNALNVRLNGNPIFTMPYDEIDGRLIINSENIYLGNFTDYTSYIVEGLLNNPQIRNLQFEALLVDPIDVSVFTKIHKNRDAPLALSYKNNNKVELNMEFIKLHSIPKKHPIVQSRKVKGEEINVVVTLPIKDSLCSDCWMIKQFFENYFDYHNNYPEFYFSQSRVLIKPQVSCARQEYRFETKFETNCPINCVCKYNGLLDKIIIDCNNKNLTEIPVIPYPEQFDKIMTIDLLFENNFLTHLTFENQNIRVLEKLSTLKFRNNNITSISLPDDHTNIIYVLDLCRNNGLLSTADNEFRIAAGNYRYLKEQCSIGSRYPRDVALYIKENKSIAEVEAYLSTVCSATAI